MSTPSWAISELPPFVVFAVVRQGALADDSGDFTSVDYRGGVVDGRAFRHRQSDDGDERKARCFRGEDGGGLRRGVEQVVAEEQVAACVTCQAEFREDDCRHPVLGGRFGEAGELFRVCPGVAKE